MGTPRLTKTEREQLAVIYEALGHTRVTVRQGARHKIAEWAGGRAVISSSPSDCKGLLALRTTVRRGSTWGRPAS
jgi:hypothetical protein